MNILETIIDNKKNEVQRQKEAVSIEFLNKIIRENERTPTSFKKALEMSDSGIIAEFKRKSPSKGWIAEHADVAEVTAGYELSGATAISVLTDEVFFGGTFDDLKMARSLLKIPLLRKDFIVDEYQIHQARAMGADVILLIASALTKKQVLAWSVLAHDLGLEVLLEIHNEAELDYMVENVDVVGINNRNLMTFETDVQCSFRLGMKIPDQYVKISESGITYPKIVAELRQAGFKGFLMGETFMKTDSPSRMLERFINELKYQRNDINCQLSIVNSSFKTYNVKRKTYNVKVCGMRDPENIKELCHLPINMLGLIFYPQSPRYVGELPPEVLPVIPDRILRVGVFVNEEKKVILSNAKRYGLQMIQLHGSESSDLCKSLKDEGYTVIKALNISDEADFVRTIYYENVCDYFLFDTKTIYHGGSGDKFNWKMLDFYSGKLPFFLSGGIGPDDIDSIAAINHEKLFAIDLNSRFEIEPGVKDVRLIRETLLQLKVENGSKNLDKF